jgi:hypothetical protein
MVRGRFEPLFGSETCNTTGNTARITGMLFATPGIRHKFLVLSRRPG